jgi:hypothetical protein
MNQGEMGGFEPAVAGEKFSVGDPVTYDGELCKVNEVRENGSVVVYDVMSPETLILVEHPEILTKIPKVEETS